MMRFNHALELLVSVANVCLQLGLISMMPTLLKEKENETSASAILDLTEDRRSGAIETRNLRAG